MHFDFPFGRAALAILLLAIVSGVAIGLMEGASDEAVGRKPDLVFVTFAKNHLESYLPAIRQMEREKGITISVQVVHERALIQRLQAAMQVGADVPDVVEIINGSMGSFARGPLEDVGFVDLTDRIMSSGLYNRMVESRFSIWSSRGRIFALPHDVHPAVLAYRRDIVEQLGIDVNKIETWDDFVRIGREVTRDIDGDGVIDRYMLDLDSNGSDFLRAFLLQKGSGIFDREGNVIFDSEEAAQVVCWYVRQISGPNKIAFSAGWGQNLAQCMTDGLALFYFTPDWRTYSFQTDVPSLSGKMALMPLPAWEKGGRRVSTWGGTGLTITKQCKNVELAWELAQRLYLNERELGFRFRTTNIVPPLKEAWNMPEFDEPRPYYSNQKIGRLFADLAPDTPADYVTPFTPNAIGKLNEAYANVKLYYERNGEEGLEEYARSELKRCADRVRQIIARNAFYAESADAGGQEEAP